DGRQAAGVEAGAERVDDEEVPAAAVVALEEGAPLAELELEPRPGLQAEMLARDVEQRPALLDDGRPRVGMERDELPRPDAGAGADEERAPAGEELEAVGIRNSGHERVVEPDARLQGRAALADEPQLALPAPVHHHDPVLLDDDAAAPQPEQQQRDERRPGAGLEQPAQRRHLSSGSARGPSVVAPGRLHGLRDLARLELVGTEELL